MAFYNPRSASRPAGFARVLEVLREECETERPDDLCPRRHHAGRGAARGHRWRGHARHGRHAHRRAGRQPRDAAVGRWVYTRGGPPDAASPAPVPAWRPAAGRARRSVDQHDPHAQIARPRPAFARAPAPPLFLATRWVMPCAAISARSPATVKGRAPERPARRARGAHPAHRPAATASDAAGRQRAPGSACRWPGITGRRGAAPRPRPRCRDAAPAGIDRPGGRRSISMGTPAARQAASALRLIWAAKGWVASTTAPMSWIPQVSRHPLGPTEAADPWAGAGRWAPRSVRHRRRPPRHRRGPAGRPGGWPHSCRPAAGCVACLTLG